MREYIDEGIRNGYAKNPAEVSKAIGVAEATVSRWRSGERTPTDEEAIKLASLLRKDAGEILAECGAARAKSPETRRAWERIAARIASYGITVCALIITIGKSEEARAYSKNDDLQRLPVLRRRKAHAIEWINLLRIKYDGVHRIMTMCLAA